ncbi:MAG: hypothetical protein DI529_10815 [Chryseobacterium sp.]|nr:MAG: hypothetical protein DI529_10815 [Chryseobacterium sp.]
MPDISVIMPVYNAEKYLRRTLENLAKQTFSNFEVLMVNDHSEDNTQDIINEFSAKDSRFKVFQNVQKGVSSARNVGLEKSTGKFIIHHDADDLMPNNALEILYNEALKSHSDVVIGNYIVKFDNKEKIEKHSAEKDPEKLINDLIHNKFHAGLWNKLIRKEFYENLKFDEDINYMEDKLILTQIFIKQPGISYMDEVVYSYIQYPESITNTLSDKSLESISKVIRNLDNIFKINNLDYDLTYLKAYYKLLALLNRKRIEFKNEFKEVNSKILQISDISIHHRILLMLKVYNLGFLSDIYTKFR